MCLTQSTVDIKELHTLNFIKLFHMQRRFWRKEKFV